MTPNLHIARLQKELGFVGKGITGSINDETVKALCAAAAEGLVFVVANRVMR